MRPEHCTLSQLSEKKKENKNIQNDGIIFNFSQNQIKIIKKYFEDKYSFYAKNEHVAERRMKEVSYSVKFHMCKQKCHEVILTYTVQNI